LIQSKTFLWSIYDILDLANSRPSHSLSLDL
jgi:hypothetical protein